MLEKSFSGQVEDEKKNKYINLANSLTKKIKVYKLKFKTTYKF